MIYALLTLLLTATFVASPYFTSPFSGFEADQLPIPQIEPPIQPEGYAFAIWGLIYGWLVVSAVFGVIFRTDDAEWDEVRKPLIVSLLVGTPWLWVANQSAVWATILIFVMAIAAIFALFEAPIRDRWWLQAPVAIYAGWLTAASFVSLGSTAAGYGILTDQVGWAYLGIIGAGIVALSVQAGRPDAPEYGLTVVWALVGIVVANGVTTLSVTLAAIVALALILGLLVSQRRTLSAA